jgi:Flp pilus assembly protein TadG
MKQHADGTTPRNVTRAFRRARARRKGASVLELSITLLLLLNLTFGTIEFGHFFFVKNTVQGAAREGARVAILPGSTNVQVRDAVNQVLTAAGMRTDDFAYTVKVDGAVADASTATAGQKIEVTVSGTWGTVGLRPLGLINSSKSVLGGVSMRREGN